MKRVLLYFVLLIGLLNGHSIYAGYEDKVNLEKNITDKAQHILDSMYGKHKFAVTSKVSLGRESWSVRYTGQAKIKGIKPKSTSDTDYLILPGYSALKNVAPDTLSRVPYNSVITKTTPKINRIILDIVVSKKITKVQTRTAAKILRSFLELDAKRGDKINYRFVTFPVAKEEVKEQAVTVRIQAMGQGQRWLLILLGVFILLYTVLQIKQLGRMSFAGRGGGSPPPPPPLRPEEKLEAGLGGLGGTQQIKTSEVSMKHYFDFITNETITGIISVLKKENLNSAHIGIIVSYLPPPLAAKIMASLDVAVQSQVMSHIIDEKVLDKELIEKLEKRVRSRLECMIGGEDIVNGLFGKIGNDDKKSILNLLQNEPDKYQKVRPNVILFDDIKYLTKDELRFVISEANLDMLSAAMMLAETETQDHMQAALPSAAKAMVNQFAQLKGKTISKSEIELAQVYILDIVTKMDKEGKIKLKEKIPGLGAGIPKETKPEMEPTPKEEKPLDDKKEEAAKEE